MTSTSEPTVTEPITTQVTNAVVRYRNTIVYLREYGDDQWEVIYGDGKKFESDNTSGRKMLDGYSTAEAFARTIAVILSDGETQQAAIEQVVRGRITQALDASDGA